MSTQSIVDIHQMTRVSLQMVPQMNQAEQDLIDQAARLKNEIDHYKI